MSEKFDVNAYWLRRGRGYTQERLPGEYHRLQEQFLLDVLREGGLPLNRILELGCGFGRVTRLLATAFPQAEILALDLSPEQLENARQYCAGLRNVAFDRYDFYSGAPFPGGGRWDTAVAIEVFLHHPASLLRDLLLRLGQAAKFIVNIDWSEPWTWGTAEHVWVHDYPLIYRELGLQCATFVLPERVDGLQQRLFVAGRQLPGAVTSLEKQLESGPQAGASPASLSPAAEWQARLARALAALRDNIPEHSTLILVNDDQWGSAAEALPARRILPFLERNGQYWGVPADDTQALGELRRLTQAGAQYLAVAWNSCWWLEHYRGFAQHLRSQGKCLFSSPDLIIFKL